MDFYLFFVIVVLLNFLGVFVLFFFLICDWNAILLGHVNELLHLGVLVALSLGDLDIDLLNLLLDDIEVMRKLSLLLDKVSLLLLQTGDLLVLSSAHLLELFAHVGKKVKLLAGLLDLRIELFADVSEDIIGVTLGRGLVVGDGHILLLLRLLGFCLGLRLGRSRGRGWCRSGSGSISRSGCAAGRMTGLDELVPGAHVLCVCVCVLGGSFFMFA